MIEQKIELIKIGETYLKFDFEFNEENKQRIRQAYLNQISQSSREVFKNKEHFKIAIEFEEGSLKTRIIILGSTLFSIYVGIGQYGSFKAGIREMINDVNWFSENTIERIDDGPNINQNDIIRTEKRTGLTGRLQELYNRIDRFERNVNNMSNVEIQNELNQIKQEVSNLSAVLPNQDEQVFLGELNDDYSENLPNPNPRRVNYLANRYGIRPDDEIEFVE
jgi:hypothetical protein